MPPSSKWWIVCVLTLPCLLRFGSCRTGRAHRTHSAPAIFQEFCALKGDPGPCKAIKNRFFFDATSGRCEVFEYGGCGGNANNFETLEECEEACVVSDDKNPCQLEMVIGPCRGLVARYFFDNTSQQCKRFYYGGCFGNANNFRSMAECQERCQNPAKHAEAPEVQTQTERENVLVQPTVAAGELIVIEPEVQLNDTNKETTDFTPSDMCFSPVDRGTCDGAERRFAYNPETKRCHMFSYSGCGGNRNNFKYRKHCIHKCIRVKKGQGNMMMIRVRKKNLDSIVKRFA
ncbi:carboxypeptidase inhibitor SmCI-like [Pholidichthys leucotaenia]